MGSYPPQGTGTISGDPMSLTPAERLIVQALIINDLTPFAGADIAAILADVTGLAGAAMRGTDGAALVADGWDAALATILDNFTALRIGYLDQLDFNLQEAIAALDTLIDGIIADIGTFPTANYATLAAYVEDIRTRLVALATSVVPKATDEQGSFTYTTGYGTAETDISNLFTTDLTGTTRRRYSVFLDLTNLEADAAVWTSLLIRVKVKIDGVNYRTVDKKDIAKTDVASGEEPGINIDIPATAKDVQITFKLDVALNANQTVPYHVVTEVLE